ncbi:MAG TPA: lysylphosphatidylglycerol synthase domain-containing protein [Solirubrobacteraceae bacterium]|nr:lysylphosphatidylglycerol synthase domain-containing protein [Solirubrobacteraceae bacterium]
MLAALAVAVTALPGLGEVRDRLAGAAPGWLLAAGLLQVLSCLAFVAALRGVFCHRLPWRLSYEVGMAAQGTNVLLPSGGAGGLALAAWALRKTGMPTERLARRTVAFYVLTSSVNFFTAVVAGLALALAGGALLWTAGPAIAAALVIGGVLALPRLFSRPRPGRAGRVLDALSAGIRDAVRLTRAGHPQILAGAIGFMAFDLLALGAAFAALGALPPLGVLALAYVLGQLGGLVPLPGGVGGADGGLIAALALYGTPLGAAVAAVLAYRAFQLGLPALLGALAVVRLPRVLERAPDVGALCERRVVRAA